MVEQRIAQEAPGLQGRGGGFDEGPNLRVEPVDGLLTCRELLPAAPAWAADLGESVDDAVLTGGTDVVDLAGRAGETHSSRPVGSVRTCTFMPCFLRLPEWKGRSASVRSVGSGVPFSSTNAFDDALRTASARLGANAARTSTALVMYR